MYSHIQALNNVLRDIEKWTTEEEEFKQGRGGTVATQGGTWMLSVNKSGYGAQVRVSQSTSSGSDGDGDGSSGDSGGGGIGGIGDGHDESVMSSLSISSSSSLKKLKFSIMSTHVVPLRARADQKGANNKIQHENEVSGVLLLRKMCVCVCDSGGTEITLSTMTDSLSPSLFGSYFNHLILDHIRLLSFLFFFF